MGRERKRKRERGYGGEGGIERVSGDEATEDKVRRGERGGPRDGGGGGLR